MNVRMQIVDRDLAYLFLDVNNAPDDSQQYDLSLDGVCFEQALNQEATRWLIHTQKPILLVMNEEDVDFDDLGDFAPIPTPVVCLTAACVAIFEAGERNCWGRNRPRFPT